MNRIIPIIGLLLVFCVNNAQSSLGEEISSRNPYPLDQTPGLKTNTTNDEYRLDSILSYRWDGEGWEPFCFLTTFGGHLYAAKTLFVYDENGNMTKRTEIDYSEYKGGYYIYQADEYSYDEHGKRTMMTNYGYDENNDLSNADMIRRMKAQYFYNETGHLTEVLHYDWDVISQEWLSSTVWLNHREYSARTIFIYEENDNIILEKGFESDTINNDWITSWKSEYTYDDYDRLINAVDYSWDISSNDWIIGREIRDSHVHDSILDFGMWWGNSNGKSTFIYDENDHLTIRIGYKFDTIDKVWVNKEKCESTYDDNNDLILETKNFWDPSNNVWTEATMDEYALDDNGNPVSRVLYWRDGKDWEVDEKLEYYYSSIDQTTDNAVFKQDASICKIYPNPTNTLLTIEVSNTDRSNIEITSLNGHKILVGKMEGTTRQLDLSTFESGVYFITIRSKDFMTTRKIVKL